MKVAILGAGKFGRAIALLSIANNHQVVLWSRKGKVGDQNLEALVEQSLEKAVANANIVYFAITSCGFTEVANLAAPFIADKTICISLTKGIDVSNGARMSEILTHHLPNHKIGVLSGPNLASEIIESKIAGTVVASQYNEVCTSVQNQLGSKVFRIYSSDDVIGVEWGGVLKNIYAIIFGICNHLHLGQNAKGILLSRGFVEMMRFGTVMGAKDKTFIGMSGLGDLYTTCNSILSRNYRFGSLIAKGKTAKDALAEIQESVEGYETTRTVYKMCQSHNISMPLAEALYKVLFLGETNEKQLKMLMQRIQTSEL